LIQASSTVPAADPLAVHKKAKIEPPWNIGGFYGQSYFANPREQVFTQAADAAILPRLSARSVRAAGGVVGRGIDCGVLRDRGAPFRN
jgi:hypothetical protein